jgi:hypothetical protein
LNAIRCVKGHSSSGKTTSGQISFDSYLGIEGRAMLVSPLNEDIIIIIKQNGQLLNFNAEAEITYSGRKQHEGSVVFSHNGSYRKFYTSSDMTYNKNSASGTVSFDTTNGIQGRATLNTPLTKNRQCNVFCVWRFEYSTSAYSISIIYIYFY